MRIGTWNLAGRWSAAHHEFLLAGRCDVWLLTEVSDRLDVAGHGLSTTSAPMASRRHWAGVLSHHELTPLGDPHPATAAALLDDVVLWSSVLPWRSCGDRAPWATGNHATKTTAAIEELNRHWPRRPLIWGGDWNHALSGREYAGSVAGRGALLATLHRHGLSVPTDRLAHRIEGLLSIDHISLGPAFLACAAERLPASGLSDHDAYVIDLIRDGPRPGEPTAALDHHRGT